MKIAFLDLEAKKPKGYGISADNYEQVIGKKINRRMKKWDFLNDDDFI